MLLLLLLPSYHPFIAYTPLVLCMQTRRAYAQMRCLWFAPHAATRSADAVELPVDKLLQQLQRLVEGIAAVFTKHAG